jgi:hypothetical protein
MQTLFRGGTASAKARFDAITVHPARPLPKATNEAASPTRPIGVGRHSPEPAIGEKDRTARSGDARHPHPHCDLRSNSGYPVAKHRERPLTHVSRKIWIIDETKRCSVRLHSRRSQRTDLNPAAMRASAPDPGGLGQLDNRVADSRAGTGRGGPGGVPCQQGACAMGVTFIADQEFTRSAVLARGRAYRPRHAAPPRSPDRMPMALSLLGLLPRSRLFVVHRRRAITLRNRSAAIRR